MNEYSFKVRYIQQQGDIAVSVARRELGRLGHGDSIATVRDSRLAVYLDFLTVEYAIGVGIPIGIFQRIALEGCRRDA